MSIGDLITVLSCWIWIWIRVDPNTLEPVGEICEIRVVHRSRNQIHGASLECLYKAFIVYSILKIGN